MGKLARSPGARLSRRPFQLAPDDAQSITFAWSLAMRKRDYAQAQRMLAKAKQKNLGAEAIARMEASLAEVASGSGASASLLASPTVVKWTLGAGLALLAAVLMRKLRRPASV